MVQPHDRGTCDNRNDLLSLILQNHSRMQTRDHQAWWQLNADLKELVAQHNRSFQEILRVCAEAELGDGNVPVEKIYEILARVSPE